MKKLLMLLGPYASGNNYLYIGFSNCGFGWGLYNPYDDQLNQKYTTKPHGDGSGSFYNSSTTSVRLAMPFI